MTATKTPRPVPTLRVLVVDDDPRVRAGLAGVLDATPGLTLVTATGSPATAIDTATNGRADLAVVDALLPTLADGVRLVRALSPLLPVVAISLDGTSRAAMLAAGALAYVEKEGAPDRLIDVLETLGTCSPR